MTQSQEPSIGDLSPVLKSGVEREPALLLDTTGSMSYPVADGSKITRMAVVQESLGRLVEALAKEDSQGGHEEGGGGLLTYTFAGGQAEELGDLNPGNVQQKLAGIQWGGGTVIMPGWQAVENGYMEEFGSTPKLDRPMLLVVIITDGEATDTQEFAAALKAASSTTYAVIALLGYGNDHDEALAAYKAVSDANNHVRVVTFGSATDPTTISDGLLSLLGTR